MKNYRFLTVLVIFLMVIAAVSAVSFQAERNRLKRIAAAEVKYEFEHGERVRNGEGTSMWLTSSKKYVFCQISGQTDNPILRCGENKLEPPVADR